MSSSTYVMVEVSLLLLLGYLLYNVWHPVTLVIPAIIFTIYKIIKKKHDMVVSGEGRNVLITGCDTGFGHALAKKLDEKGFTVFAACLDENGAGSTELKMHGSDRLHVLPLDVTSDDSVSQCLDHIKQHCTIKGLWALVNNAGIMSYGDVELCTIENYKQVSEVDLFGLIRVTRAFLPLVRRAKGRVVNVTSVRGLLAFPANSTYVVSKFGAEAFSDVLRLEMKYFGVKVIVVEPGNYGGITGILNEKNRSKIKEAGLDLMTRASDEVRSVYGDGRMDQLLQAAIQGLSTSCITHNPVVDVMVNAVMKSSPPLRTLVGGSNRLVDIDCFLARIRPYLPEPWMDALMEYFCASPPIAKTSLKGD